MGQHYFSTTPAGPERRRPLTVQLGGRRLTVQTSSGVFCPDRVDQGTAVLLRHAPAPPPGGALLDLGCGWGPLALALAIRSPQADVWAVDVNDRALRLTRDNAAAAGLTRVHAVTPDDVPADLEFAALWSNPPIRIGKAAVHELLLRWLPRLGPGGTAYLVVQRNLGSDSLLRWLGEALPAEEFGVRRYASERGYRLIEVARRAAASGQVDDPVGDQLGGAGELDPSTR